MRWLRKEIVNRFWKNRGITLYFNNEKGYFMNQDEALKIGNNFLEFMDSGSENLIRSYDEIGRAHV